MAVTKRLRFEVLRRDNHTCRYCGATAPDAVLTVDHVTPVALGGSDDPTNLVAACKDCNAGKSSIAPDATIVDDVAADAIRWARAMHLASEQHQLERSQQVILEEAFSKEWDSWTNGYGKTVSRPPAWAHSIHQFVSAGLGPQDFLDLIEVAMRSKSNDPWRYFCGCCWNRVRGLQETAKALIESGAANG